MLLVILLYSFILLIDSSPVSTKTSAPPLLLLISFDGFRWDYPDIYHLPNFNSVIKRGVRVKQIENSFATITFPSHFTIVTGLYEETHGIVANTIYDPTLNAVATIETMNDTRWWSQNPYTQPIWISNQLANDSAQRRSGVIAWPGSDVPINGYQPAKFKGFNKFRPFDSVFNEIFDWFREPIETRINFGAIYHLEPDFTGHVYGPISMEMNQTLKECDDYLGQILKIIDSDEYLKKNLNVIITSDHGMHAVNETNKIILENYVDKSLFLAYGGHSFANIFVHEASNIDRIYANLSSIPNYEVYKKVQIPNDYHYKFNVRIGDILIVGKAGYEIVLPGSDDSKSFRGDHGYDNRVESMHPIFYAFGPAFRSNLVAEPFRNVDIYPLISYVLRLNPRSTNGSLERAKRILVDFEPSIITRFFVPFVLILNVIFMGFIYSICACRHSRKLVFVDPENVPGQYRLLSNDEDSTNNLVVSESENEEANK